ncbi:Serine/threonine-protein phosphatase 7 long form-like protein, partial [Mucuna pruriens]
RHEVSSCLVLCDVTTLGKGCVLRRGSIGKVEHYNFMLFIVEIFIILIFVPPDHEAGRHAMWLTQQERAAPDTWAQSFLQKSPYSSDEAVLQRGSAPNESEQGDELTFLRPTTNDVERREGKRYIKRREQKRGEDPVEYYNFTLFIVEHCNFMLFIVLSKYEKLYCAFRSTQYFFVAVLEHALSNSKSETDVEPTFTRCKSVITRVSQVLFFPIDHALISTLVERWKLETHTFHMPLDQELVIGITNVNWSRFLNELFGIYPPEEEMRGSRPKMTWLKEHFDNVAYHAHSMLQILRFTQVYILKLIGGMLFSYHSRVFVHLKYAYFLLDLQQCGQNSWGSTILANLYRELCLATNIEYREISGAYLLMQWINGLLHIIKTDYQHIEKHSTSYKINNRVDRDNNNLFSILTLTTWLTCVLSLRLYESRMMINYIICHNIA